MKKYIFLNVPAYGHINPTLAVVKELVDRGNQVFYYAVDEFREQIESTGAEYRSYNSALSAIDTHKTADFLSLMQTVINVTLAGLPELLVEVAGVKPDCIIHDSLCLWGKIIGQRLDVPTVSSITTFVVNKDVMEVDRQPVPLYRKLAMRHKARGIFQGIQTLTGRKAEFTDLFDILMNTEKLNIVYTSRMLQPKGNRFSEEYQFVGASIGTRTGDIHELGEIPEDKPVIYISLGTITNQNYAFYKDCFEAFKDMNATVILSAGKNTDTSRLDPIPPNFIVRNFVPQLDVLAISDVFITHGGMNSVHEGLYYKVPLIVVPQQREQQRVADRIAECGAGIYLEKPDANSLSDAVRAILSDAKYEKAAESLSQSLIIAGGYKKAADLLEKYCNAV
ncbi:MAG: glucosyltransferase [Chloroflexi bacterium]|nr:glucosyltransferase [Chloroflexota bacterium]